MFPMYKDMSSHPYQSNNPIPSPQFYNPTWETFPPQVKENQANPPQVHEHCPHNYPYPFPMPCQNCCTHGQHPSYYSVRPPFPHFPSPSPYGHYYGYYPAAFPQPYPCIPPPPFPMEMPRYEYDQGLPKPYHCCECPNHPSHVKSTNNVKIEEHDPDMETNKAKSLVPRLPTGVSTSNSSNSPYPIMWVPPGYVMNNEQPKREVPETDSNGVREQGSSSVKRDPNVKYQWFPLDMNTVRRLMEGGEVVKPQDPEKKGEDEKKVLDLVKKDPNNKQFPHPMFCMPYSEQKDDHTKGQNESNSSKIPRVEQKERSKGKQPADVMKHPDNEQRERILAGDHANGAGNLGNNKTSKVRVIPVKQLDDTAPNSLKKEQESEVNGSLKNAGETGKNGIDMKASCPTRKSKLPPICLRVDPPRKKNGKGSSMVSSPPNEKNRQESCDSKAEGKDKESRASKDKVQVKEVVKNDPNGNNAVLSHGTDEEEKRSLTREHHEAAGKVVQDSDSSKANDIKRVDDGVQVRKIPSVEEAAVIIQSAYRGYVVRRWEPLKKLGQIAEVREEAGKVKSQIEKLESCVSVDNKEKVAVGETIMNLLLKLDALQGLHSSIRDIRKSVAKQLVMLQERLDNIVSQNSVVNSATEGVKKHCTSLDSSGNSVVSLDTVTDSSKISEQGEASKEGEGVEDHPETLTVSEEPGTELYKAATAPENSPLELKNLVAYSRPSDITPALFDMEVNPGAKLIQETVEEQVENDSSVETQEEVNEKELDKPSIALETSSTELSEDMDTCIKDQEANLAIKSSEELVEEQVENDICRVDWECDLGSAKITPGVVHEASQLVQESDEQIDEVEKVEEKHIPAELQGDVMKENEKETIEAESPGGNKDQHVEDKHVQAELQGEVIKENERETEAESPGENKDHQVKDKHVQAGSHGEVIKENERETEAESTGGNKDQKGEQPIDMPEMQSDDFLATEKDHHVTAEAFDEERLGAQESEITNDQKCREDQLSEHEVPVVEVEKEVIKEGRETEVDVRLEELKNGSVGNLQVVTGDQTTEIPIPEGGKEEVIKDDREAEVVRRLEELPNDSLGNPQMVSVDQTTDIPISDGGKEECNWESSPSLITGQYKNGPEVSSIERRIIEENEKLKNMVEKLLVSGKEQQDVISNLTAKVKDLEKKLPRKNKMIPAKHHGVIVSRRKSPAARVDN